MPVELEFDPDVFHGELTANRAQVFVRTPRTADLADCTLHGYVHGPRCEYAHTLPAKFTLQDLGPGPTLLARATLTDPCLWTSDLPQIYDVHIELRRGSEVLAREQRMLGLRGIGTRHGDSPQLIREGKVWVPRGVAVAALQSNGERTSRLREAMLAVTCNAAPLDLMVTASRRGLYLIGRIDACKQDTPAALRTLARWPAAMMTVIHGGEALDPRLNQIAPNLLLAQAVGVREAISFVAAPWAACVWCELGSGGSLDALAFQHLAAKRLPVIVEGDPDCAGLDAAHARQECDQLQRRLAPTGQFAGYFIGPARERSAIDVCS